MKKISNCFYKLFSLTLIFNLASGLLYAEADFDTLLTKANTFYESLQNYECTFTKTEAKNGILDEAENIFMRFEKPFKIFMGWEGGRKKGLQVFYERGRFDNKLVIHQPGALFGLLQIVFLDQSSPWVREGSASFNIEDAGIGTFLRDFTKAVYQAKSENKFKVNPIGENYEIIFGNTQKSDVYFAYRVIVSFDPGTSLPVWQELYDWENKLIGIYEYKNLKLNIKDDQNLKTHIHRALYKIYTSKPEPVKVYKATSNFNTRT